MAPIEELFAEYVFAEKSGEGDPRPFLNRTSGTDRERLGEMIDSYLATAPGREWDPQAFQGSPAQRMVEPLARALNGVSGTWPVVLPGLRERAKIKRSELVDQLAQTLGFPKQRETVDEYYHGMEYGTVESEGVSDKVLDALAEILGSGRDALRRSGQMMGGGGSARGEIVFARVAPDLDASESSDLVDRIEVVGVASDEMRSADPDHDAVVELFTGGQ